MIVEPGQQDRACRAYPRDRGSPYSVCTIERARGFRYHNPCIDSAPPWVPRCLPQSSQPCILGCSRRDHIGIVETLECRHAGTLLPDGCCAFGPTLGIRIRRGSCSVARGVMLTRCHPCDICEARRPVAPSRRPESHPSHPSSPIFFKNAPHRGSPCRERSSTSVFIPASPASR
jgi:hypothetical protein